MSRSLRLLIAFAIVTVAAGCASTATNSQHPHSAPGDLSAASARPLTPPPPPPRRPRSRRLSTRVASWRLPTALSRGVVVRSGTGAVLAGGLRPGDISSDLVYQISPVGVRYRMPPLAQSLHDAAGAAWSGHPLIIGGGNTSEMAAVESRSNSRQWRISGHLPGPRSDLSALSTSRGLLVIGGYDGFISPRQILRSSDGQHFATFARLRYGVRYAAVVGVGDSVWVIGGEDRGRELNTTQVIDLTTRRVSLARRLPTPLGHAAAALVGSRILLMGGRTAPHRITKGMWWVDPRTGQYSPAGQLPYPLADAGVLSTVGGIYLLGGEVPRITNRVVQVRYHT